MGPEAEVSARPPATRIVLLGRQGAGKGTQAERLARHFGVPRISTGDMFRAGARLAPEWGREIQASMEAGELVPDEVVVAMVQKRLTERDAADRGFILEGFPRTAGQAEALDSMLLPTVIDAAIELIVPVELVLARLAARRVCMDCGANYSVAQPPAEDWTCDGCGGRVVERQDDNAVAITRRLALYEEQTAPLVEWYESSDRLERVDGTGPPDEVSRRLKAAVEHRRGRARPPSWVDLSRAERPC